MALRHTPADVPALVGVGLSNPEIDARLHLGVTIVETQPANLMTKTGSANRVPLAIDAKRPPETDDGEYRWLPERRTRA